MDAEIANYSGCNCSATSLFDLGAGTIETSLPVLTGTITPAGVSASVSSTAPSSSSFSASQEAAPAASTPTPHRGDKSNTTALSAGLGVSLGVAFILGVLAVIWAFRRRKSPKQPQGQAVPPGYLDSKKELDASEMRRLPELHSTPEPGELDAGAQKPRALDGSPLEMPS